MPSAQVYVTERLMMGHFFFQSEDGAGIPQLCCFKYNDEGRKERWMKRRTRDMVAAPVGSFVTSRLIALSGYRGRF